jgi:hypothetical protein
MKESTIESEHATLTASARATARCLLSHIGDKLPTAIRLFEV